MSDSACKFHIPSPLDLMFFAFDHAGRRMSRPGAFIHIQMEVEGQIDIEGFRRAVRCVHRLYPATQSRLERSPALGRPRWRLAVPGCDLNRVVRLHQLSPATEGELQDQINGLLAQTFDLVNHPPVHFHVFRGLERGDVLVMRFPHALMDGRGGFLILEEIARRYRENTDPSTLSSVGDECLDDFNRLLAGDSSKAVSVWPWRRDRPTGPRSPQLPPGGDFREIGPLRWSVRRFSNEQCLRMKEVSQRICPEVRFGAFLRANAIRALHPLIGMPKHANASYSIPYLTEGRQPPYTAPVCRNMFSLERLHVPVRLANDRAAVAKILHEETANMLARGLASHHLDSVKRVTRLPTAIVGTMVRMSVTREPLPWQWEKASDPPSLPMGFVRAFAGDVPTFCGATVLHTYVFRPPLPRAGIGIQVAADQGKLVIAGLCFQKREKEMHQFLDSFADSLVSID